MRFGLFVRAASGATAVLSAAIAALSGAAHAQGSPPQDTITVFEDSGGRFCFERDAETRSSVGEHCYEYLPNYRISVDYAKRRLSAAVDLVFSSFVTNYHQYLSSFKLVDSYYCRSLYMDIFLIIAADRLLMPEVRNV